MCQVLEWTIPLLPQDKPRHLLGIGEIKDIFEVVKRGIDLFDCVAPTRMARTETLFAKEAERFRIHILNAQFKDDSRPIDEGCNCDTCRNYSRAYLRHLCVAKELLGKGLNHFLAFLESQDLFQSGFDVLFLIRFIHTSVGPVLGSNLDRIKPKG